MREPSPCFTPLFYSCFTHEKVAAICIYPITMFLPAFLASCRTYKLGSFLALELFHAGAYCHDRAFTESKKLNILPDSFRNVHRVFPVCISFKILNLSISSMIIESGVLLTEASMILPFNSFMMAFQK